MRITSIAKADSNDIFTIVLSSGQKASTDAQTLLSFAKTREAVLRQTGRMLAFTSQQDHEGIVAALTKENNDSPNGHSVKPAGTTGKASTTSAPASWAMAQDRKLNSLRHQLHVEKFQSLASKRMVRCNSRKV